MLHKNEFIKRNGNKDDSHKAIDALNTFTHYWCVDVVKTESTGNLSFKCSICKFKDSGRCILKSFAGWLDEEYCEDIDFGAMGKVELK